MCATVIYGVFFIRLANESMHNHGRFSHGGEACRSNVQQQQQQAESCHMVESSTADERHRVRGQTRQGDGEGGRGRIKRGRKRCAVQRLKGKRQRKETNRGEKVKKKDMKGKGLTCPAAGGACPPSPGAGLAGLCLLLPALWPPRSCSRGEEGLGKWVSRGGIGHMVRVFVNVAENVR